MLRFEDIAFGPVHSRRLGSSLGVNLLPAHGKLCNFDCIYCECGWNKDGAGDRSMPSPEDVRAALADKLEKCSREGIGIDSITFSGNGEPTLNPAFADIIDIVLELRDRYYPKAKVSVLSNATMVGKKDIFNALRKVDNPILKIDASSTEGVMLINRPAGHYDLLETVENLKRFEGDFILQTMFLKAPEFDSADEANLAAWMELVKELRPREIMVYTLDRETPEKDLTKYSVDEMTKMVRPLIDAGFSIQIRG